MNFSQGHSGTKVQCESCLFSQGKKQQNSQKWAKFMNFSFCPFLWFGLPGRLLKNASAELWASSPSLSGTQMLRFRENASVSEVQEAL